MAKRQIPCTGSGPFFKEQSDVRESEAALLNDEFVHTRESHGGFPTYHVPQVISWVLAGYSK
jgi:hypothetical protein